jgi:hypothetical protein
MKERIICAAIKLVESGKCFYGHKHNHCIEAMNDKLSWTLNRQEIYKVQNIQGFVTSLGRFVNRKKALQIALNNDQVLDIAQLRGVELYSEDLY